MAEATPSTNDIALDIQSECRGIDSLAVAADKLLDETQMDRHAEEHLIQLLRFIRLAAERARDLGEQVERMSKSRD